MNKRRRIDWILPFVPLALLAAHYARQFFAVDSCMDRGGVFDYSRAACRFDVTTLPYEAYSAQYRSLILAALVLSAAFAILAVVRGRPRREGR